jgi:hypothetical protein
MVQMGGNFLCMGFLALPEKRNRIILDIRSLYSEVYSRLFHQV